MQLGKTGIEVPSMVIGTSSLGNLYQSSSFSDKLELVKTALDCFPGLTVFDSAGKYGAGLALESLGKALNELNVPKDQVIISNKLGWRRTPLKGAEPTFEKDVWKNLEYDAVQDISYHGILNCFEEGNTLLGGFKSQLVSVHDPDEYLAQAGSDADYKIRFQDILEAYRALADLKKAGKVKAIGIGSKSWQVIRKIHEQVKLDWVMIANSMTIYSHPSELLHFMEQMKYDGVGIINSAVFHSGFLVGGDYFDYEFAGSDNPAFQKQHQWRSSFFELCTSWGIDPAHACIQFGLRFPGVSALALNSTSTKRIQKNAAYCQTPIESGFWKELKEKQLIKRDSKISI